MMGERRPGYKHYMYRKRKRKEKRMKKEKKESGNLIRRIGWEREREISQWSGRLVRRSAGIYIYKNPERKAYRNFART